MVATATGKDWDESAQEWVYYDLKNDADRTLQMSEEDFVKELSMKGSAAAVFNPYGDSSTGNKAGGKRKEKSVMDKELYDVLGVATNATTAEIKKVCFILELIQSHQDTVYTGLPIRTAHLAGPP